MRGFSQNFTLRPELRRACRSGVAFLVALLVCHELGRPLDGLFLAMAAQTIALPDLRGDYRVRLLILTVMTLVVAFAAVLGVWSGGNIWSATLAAGCIALLGGVWRQLSAEYGPQLSVASALLFLLGLSRPGSLAEGWHLAELILIGGAFSALLQVGFWLFRPQHALRYAVGEAWVAMSDVIANLRPNLASPDLAARPGKALLESELELRASLDRTFLILGAAETKGSTALLAHLEEMRREVVHLAMRVTGLHAALEPLLELPEFTPLLPTLDSVLFTLHNTTRSVAFTLISHREENFAATEVRIQRCLHLIHVFEEQMASHLNKIDRLQLSDALQKMTLVLPRIGQSLHDTIDHGKANDYRASLPTHLPDLSGMSARSLAATVLPTQEIDPVLVRHALRMMVLMMAGVAIYKGFQIPHGYWIALTMVIVLQPDYGSTRTRAIQRIGGTVAGSLLGSALLWIHLPLLLLDFLAGAMSFGFAYFLKNSYGKAVFFVTLLVVLITETVGPVHLDFTVTRLVCSAVGGGVALLSALVFWPAWEGGKFPALLAESIQANRHYLSNIRRFLEKPETDPGYFLADKRKAENANRFAAASLQRLLAEPRASALDSQRGTALTTYNQRITRAMTAIAVHLEDGPVVETSDYFNEPIQELDRRLEKLAVAVSANAGTENAEAMPPAASPQSPVKMENLGQDPLIWSYLAKSLAESQAMILALKDTYYSTG